LERREQPGRERQYVVEVFQLGHEREHCRGVALGQLLTVVGGKKGNRA
jgi:hypothetical protein